MLGQFNFAFEDSTASRAQRLLADSYRTACGNIAKSVSPTSQVFYPGSPEFDAGISHWANSSSQVSVCSVEPGTSQDVGQILRELASTHTPFAVKAGGHTCNPGFSSTPGVHISLTRFNDIVIHEDSETVAIGAGLTWADVYAYLVPKGINVVGGRLGGAGVAGYTLGGGYSWKTNQYGLTADTVTEFELVLPNGEIKVVTEMDEDLWFALKGGFNNYGIVTKFTLKSHKQNDVWGASLNFAEDLVDAAQAAFAKFLTQQHDTKAAQLGEFVYINGSVLFGLSLFYDGPVPPEGLYDDLLNLPSTSKSIVKGSFMDFTQSLYFTNPFSRSTYFDGVPVLHYTEPIIKALANETKVSSSRLSKYDASVMVIYTLDPFEPDFLAHGGQSAFPPDRSRPVFPSGICYGWTDESVDKHMADAMHRSVASMLAAGIKDGQDLTNAAPYVNYALFGTPLERIYGGQLKRLREIRRQYDPEDIMGLTGGWKF
ncbi:FAD-binding domain-containing protein [Lactifluus subvellereus]|nr:FAD-binding domain-containing protein [Lactifluus subvellereus]